MRALKTIVITVILVSILRAEAGINAGILLDTCPGARPAARGNAFVAASDVYSINYNPGALADIENIKIETMYIVGALDTGYEYGAFVLPVKEIGVLGISIFMFQGGTMEVVDAFGNSTAKSAQNDYLFSFALGKKNILLNNLNLGLTVKYLLSSLAETYNASTFTFDFGGTYKMENLIFGFAAYNLIGGLKYIEATDTLPVFGRVGAEYLFALDTENELTTSFETGYDNEKTFKVSIGAEYSYQKSFFGRVGYRLNDGDGGISIGIGYKGTLLENSTQSIDYAFIPSLNGLMDSHRFSVGITFGEEDKKDSKEKKKAIGSKRIIK